MRVTSVGLGQSAVGSLPHFLQRFNGAMNRRINQAGEVNGGAVCSRSVSEAASSIGHGSSI
jgi:hypothetical protein